ncbi:hypothetical protein tloyanaT_00110 [Thalassotalea loyana]|uniref:Uncharacterized protein n=1 Tax=Thalassotalea loyana TaxID=280483 RepID=A0ABQ6H715_9GAMM|nr:hypothetical protein tloyanaT_00110 [Thalassotalea loyana]
MLENLMNVGLPMTKKLLLSQWYCNCKYSTLIREYTVKVTDDLFFRRVNQLELILKATGKTL